MVFFVVCFIVPQSPNRDINPPTPHMGGLIEVECFESPPSGGFRGLKFFWDLGVKKKKLLNTDYE
jgi:hypothetical protein